MTERLLARLPDLHLTTDQASLPRRAANFISGFRGDADRLHADEAERAGRGLTFRARAYDGRPPAAPGVLADFCARAIRDFVTPDHYGS